MINELNGHGWHTSSSGRVSNDHHLDILVAQGLRTPISHGFLAEKTVKHFGLFIRRAILIFTTLRRGRLNCTLAKEFLDRAVLWLLSLTIYQLGQPRTHIAQELIAASEVNAVTFAREDRYIISDIKRQDNS